MRQDNQLLVLTHISQLLNLITGLGGLIVPLIIWLSQKDKVAGMDFHGKMILNFQISIFIYSIVSIPLIFLFGLGIFMLIGIAIIAVVLPILNAIRVSNGEIPNYPLTIEFIKWVFWYEIWDLRRFLPEIFTYFFCFLIFTTSNFALPTFFKTSLWFSRYFPIFRQPEIEIKFGNLWTPKHYV